jgi:hypothetical protein
MIKYMIITILMISVSMSATANDGGKDKWPNNRTSSRSFKKHGQPFLTNHGLNYKKFRKHQIRAKRQRNNRSGCNGAN